MECTAAASLLSLNLCLGKHGPCLPPRVLKRGWNISVLNNTQFGFSRHWVENTRTYQETPCVHGTFKFKALLDNKHFSNITFHEYVPEEKKASFVERLFHAWRILFPPKAKPVSNAEIAKQRLKMILISDRCAVSDEAKRRIVTNIVGALSDFVEIESEEKVQLNVSTDPDLGTVYSVTVPVRRVKPEYQDYSRDLRNFEYRDGIGEMRTVDIRFEYPDFRDGQS